MVSDKLKAAEQLSRKASVPAEHRTTDRTNAADWIEEHILRAGRWSEVTMVQIAEESGWSRQHIANTLQHYFEPADPSGRSLEINGIDVELLLEVYRYGYRAGQADAGDNAESKDFEEAIQELR